MNRGANDYAVQQIDTGKLLTPICCGKTPEDCKEFRDMLNSGEKKNTRIIAFGWYEIYTEGS